MKKHRSDLIQIQAVVVHFFQGMVRKRYPSFVNSTSYLLDGAHTAISTKFCKMRRPTCWLFSGWNCTPNTFARPTTEGKSRP